MIYLLATIVVLLFWGCKLLKKDLKETELENKELRRQNQEMLLINYKLTRK